MSVQGHNIRVGKVEIYAEEQGTATSTVPAPMSPRPCKSEAAPRLSWAAASDEPIEVSAFELLFKQLGVDGALTGTPKAGEATLRFSAMSDVAAMVETMPLERAPEAYARMMSGQARFRMVLTMA